jgi:hypothetical protein
MRLDASHLKCKIYVIALIVGAGFTSVLLHGCAALVSDAGFDTITDNGQLLDEPIQTPSQRVDSGEMPYGSSRGDWASIHGQPSAGKYRAYQLERVGFVSSNPANGRQIHYAADGTATLRVIDDVDASDPLIIDPSLQQQDYLRASNTNGEGSFGGRRRQQRQPGQWRSER